MPQLTLLEAAKSIRQFLPKLLEEDAPEMDRKLAELINTHQPSTVLNNQIISLLSSHDATRQWMRDAMAQDTSGRVSRGPGYEQNQPLGLAFVGAPKYVCPHGDYIWHHIDSSDTIPNCPTHDCPLEREP